MTIIMAHKPWKSKHSHHCYYLTERSRDGNK